MRHPRSRRVPVASAALALTLLANLACRSKSSDDERGDRGDRGNGEHEKEGDGASLLGARLPPGAREIPWSAVVRAREQLKEMPRYSTALGQPVGILSLAPGLVGSWAEVGPGNIGARIRDLAIHAKMPSIVLAAADTGGIYRSVDGGVSWRAVGDDLEVMHVSDVIFDPNAGEEDVAYAATTLSTADTPKGAGIYRSLDAGLTWTILPKTIPSATNHDFDRVQRIAISKGDKKRLYAATNSGILRSTDRGDNWSSSLDTGGQDCTDVALRTDVGGVDFLVAGCGRGTSGALWRNTDAAGVGTWQRVYTNGNYFNAHLAIAPSDQTVMYASVVRSDNFALLAFLRSTDAGATWTARPVQLPLLSYCNQDFGAGWAFNAIAVDPLLKDTVWVGGNWLWRSDDGGANWGKAQTEDQSQPSALMHADFSALVFPPQFNGTTNKQLFVGCDGGIYTTSDARATTHTQNQCTAAPFTGTLAWTSHNKGLTATQFYHGVSYARGTKYLGGTQDNATNWGADSTGVNGWVTKYFSGDGGPVAVDFSNNLVQFAIDGNGHIGKSTDEGATWVGNNTGLGITDAQGHIDPVNGDVPGGSHTPLFVDPGSCTATGCGRLWTAGNYIWLSLDGVNYARASTSFADGPLTAMAVAATDPNRMLAGTGAGGLYLTNGATNATSTTAWPAATTPRAAYLSSLIFDPSNHDIAYATYSSYLGGHVYRSSNGGSTWVNIDGSGASAVPDLPVHTLAVNPYQPSTLYIGTEFGVMVSTDGGASWASETGLPHAIVHRLEFDAASSQLIAFTYGRSVWKVAVPNSNATSFTQVTPAAAAVVASCNDGNVPANTVDNNLGTRWSCGGDGQWIKYDLGTSRKVAYLTLAVYNGTTRKNRFDLQVSSDNVTWKTVWAGSSNGLSTAQETYDFPDVDARYVRYLGHGHVTNTGTTSTMNSVTEVDIFAANTSDLAPPTVSIAAPASGASVSGATASVSATASDDVGVLGVQFKLDGANLGAEDSAAPYAVVWDTTAAAIGSHSLTAVARDASGKSTTTAAVSVNVNNAPAGLTAAAGNGQVTICWQAVSGATGYNVKRATTSGGPYTTAGSSGTTCFTNMGLANGTTYFYVVSATTSTFETANSAQVSATPTAGSPPLAPTGLAPTAGDAQVMLSWTASTGATSYNVKRATTSGGPYTMAGTATVPRFVNAGLTNGTSYFFVVTAVNANGESGNSAQVSATPGGATCKTATGGASGAGAWVNSALPSQAGTFTAEYDATPSGQAMDAVVGLSKAVQTAFSGFATLTRFNASNAIDARNGGAYAASTAVAYTAGTRYHFRLVVNVAAHSYSVFVTAPGGAEQTIGSGFAFRTEQNTVTSLDNWGVVVNQAGSSLNNKVCNFWVHP
jgi:hypothetical protein